MPSNRHLTIRHHNNNGDDDDREIEAHTGAITDLFREAEKLLAGVAKQQGDESDSELKVRFGIICVVSCNERSDVTGRGRPGLVSTHHTTTP